MPERRRTLTPLLLGGAAALGLWAWSRRAGADPYAAGSVLDARALARRELSRRQAAGSTSPAMETLSTVLKIGGSLAALGGTAWKILSKVLAGGTEEQALAAVTTLIDQGPTGVVAGLTEAQVDLTSVQEFADLWSAGLPASPALLDPLVETPALVEPLAEPVGVFAEGIVEPLTVAPEPVGVFAEGVVDFSTLELPPGLLAIDDIDGLSSSVVLRPDGTAVLSLTGEQVDAARQVLAAYDSGDLARLMPAQEFAALEQDIPAIRALVDGGDWAGGRLDVPISTETIRQATAGIEPTAPGFSLQQLLDTPVWTRTELIAGAEGEMIQVTQVTTLGDVVQVVGAVAAAATAAAGIAFTILSDLPDYQKALYTAMDAAAFGLAFVPVWGWIASAAIQVVKFVTQLVLGEEVSHEQREAREVQALLGQAASLGHYIQAQALSIDDLMRTLAAWNSGTVGGTQPVAVMTWITLPDGSVRLIGLHDGDGLRVATREEFLANLDTFTASIQGGVKPEFLAEANRAIAAAVKAVVPLMQRAELGDFEATQWLVYRGLAQWLPAADDRLRHKDQVLATLADPATNYETVYRWWREAIEQTAYNLQALVWGFPSWSAMLTAAVGVDLFTLSRAALQAWLAERGWPDFERFRQAFFDFAEPLSQAYMEAQIGMDKVYDLQKQIERLTHFLAPATGPYPIQSEAEMQTALAAQAQADAAAQAAAQEQAFLQELYTAGP